MKIFKTKNKGFMLAEAIIAILITVLCFEILYSTINTVRTVSHKRDGVNNVAFAYIQLNRFIKDRDLMLDIKHSDVKRAILKQKKKDEENKVYYETYSFYERKGQLRMSQVYMPLMMNLRTVYFSYVNKDVMKMKIVERDGRCSILAFKLKEMEKDQRADEPKK